MREAGKSQHRTGGRVGRAPSRPPGSCPLAWHERQNFRSSGGLVSLTFSSLAKRIWTGFPCSGDRVLVKAAEPGLLLLGCAASVPLSTAVTSPLHTGSEDCVCGEGVGEEGDCMFCCPVRIYV